MCIHYRHAFRYDEGIYTYTCIRPATTKQRKNQLLQIRMRSEHFSKQVMISPELQVANYKRKGTNASIVKPKELS